MEALFFCSMGVLIILAVIILKYLNGDFTYHDEVIGLDNDIYTIRRTYDNNKIIIFKKKMYVKT